MDPLIEQLWKNKLVTVAKSQLATFEALEFTTEKIEFPEVMKTGKHVQRIPEGV